MPVMMDGYCWVKSLPLKFSNLIFEIVPILDFLPGTVRPLFASKIKNA